MKSFLDIMNEYGNWHSMKDFTLAYVITNKYFFSIFMGLTKVLTFYEVVHYREVMTFLRNYLKTLNMGKYPIIHLISIHSFT